MTTSAEKWTDSFLAEMRMAGDPLADQTIDRVFESGQIDEVNRMFRQLVRNDQIVDDIRNPIIEKYLQDTETIRGADWAKIAEAQEFFAEHGNVVLFTLVCSSLPECYTMKKGINVLWMTQRLEEHVLRRLLETAQMVTNVLAPGGLEPHGAGKLASAKVRLMHAAIRRLILHRGVAKTAAPPEHLSDIMEREEWNQETLGYPINQMDLAYTLLTFSHVIPRGLQKLGVPMTPSEKDSFLHLWNVVGQIMGIRREMLPDTPEEAEWLFAKLKRLEGGSSAPGIQMTKNLIGCMKQALPTGALDFLPVQLMRALLDEETCEWLEIPKPGLLESIGQKLLVDTIGEIAFLKQAAHEDLVLTPHVWDWMSGKIVAFLTNFEQPPGWNRSNFTIPDTLAGRWKTPRIEGT